MGEPKNPPLLDLVSLCRDSDQVYTEVLLTGRPAYKWILLGQIRLRPPRDRHPPREWELSAYLTNATDFEHDSAFVLRMGLIGVEFDGVEYGGARFSGWVSPDVESFQVPDPGYNPLLLPGAGVCKECENNHVIVPEKFYVPRANPELLKLVAGRPVEVWTGIKPR